LPAACGDTLGKAAGTAKPTASRIPWNGIASDIMPESIAGETQPIMHTDRALVRRLIKPHQNKTA
jgi:hypothetical protein